MKILGKESNQALYDPFDTIRIKTQRNYLEKNDVVHPI
jgi:hypothetical protein